MDFTHPTEVQRATLHKALPQPPSTLGEDVVIHAQTGSGKSLAYLLPAITAVDPGRASTQALIVVPTQELGMQVYKLLRRLISAYGHDRSDDLEHSIDAIIDADFDDGTTEQDTTDEPLVALEQPSLPTVSQSFPVLPMLNQANLRRQKLQLRQAAPRIIVGNPHRIAQLVDSGRLRLDLLKVLVVDEFDACLLDTSTTSALQTILSVRGKEGPRQTILASATVPQHRHFLRQCVRQMWTRPDIRHVWVEQTSGERVPSSLTHLYAVCEARKKLRALNMLIVRFNNQLSDKTHTDFGVKAIVFVMASRSIQEIVDALNTSLTARYSKQDAQLVVGIDNDLPIVLRRDALNRFRKGEARVLVATDLAARGLDIPDISHVFHFDLPTEPDAYLHRAGRAARQGRSGTSVVLVSAGEGFVISRTSNALGIEFDRIGR